jgi:hypothetical protein
MRDHIRILEKLFLVGVVAAGSLSLRHAAPFSAHPAVIAIAHADAPFGCGNCSSECAESCGGD